MAGGADVERLLVAVAELAHSLAVSSVEHTLDGIQSLIEVSQWRSEGDADKVVAGRREEITSVRGIDVKEDSGNDDSLFLEEFLEEGQTVTQRFGKSGEVEPDVKSGNWWSFYWKTHIGETLKDMVTLAVEMLLKSKLLGVDSLRLQEGESGNLERMTSATVQERTTLTESANKVFGTNNPADTPTRETEVLGKTVDKNHRVFVYVINVTSSAQTLSVILAFLGVDIPRIELV